MKAEQRKAERRKRKEELAKMEAERLAKAARHEKPEDIPVPGDDQEFDDQEFDPDIHDYHPRPSTQPSSRRT